MKVLVISAAFPPLRAGEADYTLHLCHRLVERNFEVEVLTTAQNGVPEVGDFEVFPIVRRWTWSEVPRIMRHIRKSKPDVILLNYIGWLYGRHPMVNYLPLIAKRAAPWAKFVTLMFNSMGASSKGASFMTMNIHRLTKLFTGQRYAGFEFGNLLSDSDRIIVFSDRHRETLIRACPSAEAGIEPKIEIIPPFPILNLAPGDRESCRKAGRERLAVSDDEFVFAYFGYVYPGKGLDVLLQAFRNVMTTKPKTRLVVIGGNIDPGFSDWTTYTDCLRHLAWASGVDANVVWAGGYAWNSDEPSLYLHAADACVLPFDVGLQLNNSSAAAAATHGLPIISTRGARLESAFVSEENVLLTTPRDPSALTSAMLKVMDDEPLRLRLADGAKSLARDWFSPEKAIDRIESILARAASPPPKALQHSQKVPGTF